MAGGEGSMKTRQPIFHMLLLNKAASVKKTLRRRHKKYTRRQAALRERAFAHQVASEWISFRNQLRRLGATPHTASIFDDPEAVWREPHPQALLTVGGNDPNARRKLLDECWVHCGCGMIGSTRLSVRDLSFHVQGLGCPKCGALLPLIVDAVMPGQELSGF